MKAKQLYMDKEMKKLLLEEYKIKNPSLKSQIEGR
jgi:hypothetical protein